MVYISPDGRICEKPPWSIRRIFGVFWGIIAFILYFFKSLFGLEDGSGRYGSRSYGGGPGSGPGNGPGRGPRIGRINTSIQDCSMPGGG